MFGVKRTTWTVGKIHIMFAESKSSSSAGKKKKMDEGRCQTITVFNSF